MKQLLGIFTFMIFSLIIKTGYSNDTNHDEAIIRISSIKNSNQSFQIYYPFFGTSINLNSEGYGSIIIPIKNMSFTEISLDNINTIPLFLRPGDNLLLTIKDNHFLFTGKGSAPNGYLLKSMLLLKELKESIRIVYNDDSPERFITLCNSFESKFAAFHEKYSDSVSFSKEEAYLLKKNINALVLIEKQNYLSSFPRVQVDSLNLDNKLQLWKNEIYRDTLLIKAHSMNFKTLLYLHHNYEMKKIISQEEIENGLYPALSAAVIKERYSLPIQEFLLFTDLTTNIQTFGLTYTLDSIAEKLKKIYPSSEYLSSISKAYKEFEHLFKGSEAPDFQAVTLDNKSCALNDFRGKVVLIDVWATWCGSCIKSFPAVYALKEEFNNKAVVFLFVSIDKDEAKWKEFLMKHSELNGIHFRINDHHFDENYKITAVPRYILIDKEGKIVNAFESHPNYKTKLIITNLLK